jgi:hypothetical protein
MIQRSSGSSCVACEKENYQVDLAEDAAAAERMIGSTCR